jgi:probable HAF family extracellular repeat protein
MRTNSIIARATAIALALSATAVLAQVPATKYVVTDLGSLDGSIGTTIAQGINNAGQVVGYTRFGPTFSDPSRAFRTAANRPIQPADNLGTLGGASSFGYAINAAGQVVGDADTTIPGPIIGGIQQPNARRAFRADPGQPMIDLGTLAPGGGANGFNNSGARSINDQAVVVGFATAPVGNPFCQVGSHAFRTSPGALVNPATDDLGTLVPQSPTCPAARSSTAWGVNNAGTTVGDAATTVPRGFPNHAFRFAGAGPIQDLGYLGHGPNSTAFAINDRDQAVGDSDWNATSGLKGAFVSEPGVGMRDLGHLGSGWASAAAVNTPLSGGPTQVVGRSFTATFAARGFVWTGDAASGGTMVDLNARIAAGSPWEVTFARAINGRGQIVADAQKDGVAFVYRAVRLDPSDVATDILRASLSDPALALTPSQINSLGDKLTYALESIQAGQNKQATNQLNAFVNSVQVQWKIGKMSSATAATLTAAANAIIATLV